MAAVASATMAISAADFDCGRNGLKPIDRFPSGVVASVGDAPGSTLHPTPDSKDG